jgi:hypothetical protein
MDQSGLSAEDALEEIDGKRVTSTQRATKGVSAHF